MADRPAPMSYGLPADKFIGEMWERLESEPAVAPPRGVAAAAAPDHARRRNTGLLRNILNSGAMDR